MSKIKFDGKYSLSGNVFHLFHIETTKVGRYSEDKTTKTHDVQDLEGFVNKPFGYKGVNKSFCATCMQHAA